MNNHIFDRVETLVGDFAATLAAIHKANKEQGEIITATRARMEADKQRVEARRAELPLLVMRQHVLSRLSQICARRVTSCVPPSPLHPLSLRVSAQIQSPKRISRSAPDGLRAMSTVSTICDWRQ